MLIVIDNYDSFTYNLVQALGMLGADIKVVRNDKATVEEMASWKPSRLLISPGPCTPNEAGISVAAIRYFAGRVPVLGVCLGHQSIGVAFGGRMVRAERLMHGKTSMIRHDGKGVFRGLPNPFEAMRYHSLLVDKATLPECLAVTAWSEQDSTASWARSSRSSSSPRRYMAPSSSGSRERTSLLYARARG